eukprot:661816-Pelagomonas_calceolata.AAC.4
MHTCGKGIVPCARAGGCGCVCAVSPIPAPPHPCTGKSSNSRGGRRACACGTHCNQSHCLRNQSEWHEGLSRILDDAEWLNKPRNPPCPAFEH